MVFITSMITDRFGRHEILLPINHKNYNFRGKKNSQDMKDRENLHKKLTKKAEIVEWLWLVDLTYNFECDWLI